MTTNDISIPENEEQTTPFPVQESWHSMQILSEMVQGYEALQHIQNGITIYGSSRIGEGSPLYRDTVRLSGMLAKAGYHIITGGGPGIMEAGNRGAADMGKESTGLRIHLPNEQMTNPYVTNLCYFNNFMIRKQMFMAHSKGYIIMPGGLGTLDELSEIFVLLQTQKATPAPIVLYGKNFWHDFVGWLEQNLVAGGFIAAEDMDLFTLVNSPEDAVRHIEKHVPLV